MSPLVCFIGIDGSGKTTLCKMLVNELRSRGMRSRYVYARFLPKLMIPVFKIVARLAIDGKSTSMQHQTRLRHQRNLLRHPIISRIYIGGVLVDQILQVLVKICLRSVFRKEVTVCDRYFHDTALIDIAIPCDFTTEEAVRFIQRYINVFPKIHKVFLVAVPPRTAFQRKKDISSLTALERLSESYLYAAKHFGATTIDGTRDLSELKSTILGELESSVIPIEGSSGAEQK